MKMINIKNRPDIDKIIMQSDTDFHKWYSERKEVTERILRDYELFASIPNLGYQHENSMEAITAVRDQIDALKKGLEYLDALSELRNNFHISQG